MERRNLDDSPHEEKAVKIPTPQTYPGRADRATYRIRVVGALGQEWSERAHGMTISVHRAKSGERHTELVGELPDEAALMGVIETLYSHGARLLCVEYLGAGEQVP